MFGKTYNGVKRKTFVIDKDGTLIIEDRKVKAKTNAEDIFNLIKQS